MKGSLYIHIPFCRHRCDYCDFYSTTASSLELQTQTVAHICRQLTYIAHKWQPEIRSLYLGGGTPSYLDFSLLHQLFKTIDNNFTLSPQCEYTMEVNPEGVTPEFINFLKESPLNRISMGIQSFEESTLKLLGRSLSPKTIYQALDRLAQAPLKSWSGDLIGEIPGVQEESLLKDFQRLLQWKPPHFSCYSLSIPEKSTLEERLASQPLLSSVESLFEKAREAGYQRYEISSGALEGHSCQHNLAYWKMENFWGCGPSASGTFTPHSGLAQRWEGKSPLKAFLATENQVEESWQKENLAPKDFAFECVMMGLRLKEGISLEDFKEKTTFDFLKMAPETVKKSQRERSFALKEGRFFPLKKGFLLLNRFLLDFLIEFDKNSSIG